VPGVLILRVFGELYYANALTVRDEIRKRVEAAHPPVTALILEIGDQDLIDLTTVEVIKRWGDGLRAAGIEVYLTDVQDSVLDICHDHGLMDVITEQHIFPTTALAVRHIEAARPQEPNATGSDSDSPRPAGPPT